VRGADPAEAEADPSSGLHRPATQRDLEIEVRVGQPAGQHEDALGIELRAEGERLQPGSARQGEGGVDLPDEGERRLRAGGRSDVVHVGAGGRWTGILRRALAVLQAGVMDDQRAAGVRARGGGRADCQEPGGERTCEEG